MEYRSHFQGNALTDSLRLLLRPVEASSVGIDDLVDPWAGFRYITYTQGLDLDRGLIVQLDVCLVGGRERLQILGERLELLIGGHAVQPAGHRINHGSRGIEGGAAPGLIERAVTPQTEGDDQTTVLQRTVRSIRGHLIG